MIAAGEGWSNVAATLGVATVIAVAVVVALLFTFSRKLK